MQKYRADSCTQQKDGAVLWFAQWMGGPSLARINGCRLAAIEGDMRRTVYIIGEPDTWFSQPAECELAGTRIRGYVTGGDDGNLIFHHTYY